jgi:diketogulonate reductase-like aldo/keto reductase
MNDRQDPQRERKRDRSKSPSRPGPQTNSPTSPKVENRPSSFGQGRSGSLLEGLSLYDPNSPTPDVAQRESETQENAENWLIFGTDGRKKDELENAVNNGYRRFDCAESYNNIQEVHNALFSSSNNCKRDEFEIIYKFDVKVGEKQENLRERLNKVQKIFKGRIDNLLIHNVEGTKDDIKNAWVVINKMKQENTAVKIGLGNVKSEHEDLIKEIKCVGTIDTIENSIDSVLADENIKKIIQSTGAKLFYYDVIKTAKDIEKESPEGIKVNSPEGIKALIYYMECVNKNSSMILSSSNDNRQKENLKNYSQGQNHKDFDGDEKYEQFGAIDKWQKSANVCKTTDMEFSLPANVKAYLEKLVSGKSEDERNEITGNPPISANSIKKWLIENRQLTESDFSIKVPQRDGLKKRYLGMSLETVLLSLFGPKNCDWKWAIELVNALIVSGQDWDEAGKCGCPEIVQH